MINDFGKQDTSTILDFLQCLGSNPQCYSTRHTGFGPLIPNRDVFLYAADDEIVVVMTDPVTKGTCELADEEPFNDEGPYYFSESGHRVSPVWQLAVTVDLLRDKLKSLGNHLPATRAVLLSNARFLNYDDMREVWDCLGVQVIDRMEADLSELLLPLNTDDTLAPAFPLTYFRMVYTQQADIKAAEERLRSLLASIESSADPFSFSSFEGGDDEEEEADDEDSSLPFSLADFGLDDLENSENSETPENSEEASPAPDSGVVQQNNNSQVKVQILPVLTQPRAELDKLVGCQDIRERMDALVKMTRYNRMMRVYNPGGKEHKLSQHCVFFGRPGTGKSTVARILGSLLKESGVLSRGHVVVCNRGTFVGTSWGDEERSVNQVLEMARGGVLMIDEAYLLSTPHPNDPGKLVMQLLMDKLADESDRDLAVVICGYKEEMLQLLSLNSGLDSRFPNRFEFRDFTVSELMEIARRRTREYGYTFTRAAWQKLRRVVSEAYDHRDERTWGNARYIANLLEKLYCRHASRCVQLTCPDRKRLLTITPSDVEPIESPLAPQQPVRQPERIHITGFRQ